MDWLSIVIANLEGWTCSLRNPPRSSRIGIGISPKSICGFDNSRRSASTAVRLSQMLRFSGCPTDAPNWTSKIGSVLLTLADSSALRTRPPERASPVAVVIRLTAQLRRFVGAGGIELIFRRLVQTSVSLNSDELTEVHLFAGQAR